MGIEVVQRVARQAAESLLKLELLLVTVQTPLSLEQHALLVGPLCPEHPQRFLRDVYLRHGSPSSALAIYIQTLYAISRLLQCFATAAGTEKY